MSTTSMAIFSNPLFATYSVYARNASIVNKNVLKRAALLSSPAYRSTWL